MGPKDLFRVRHQSVVVTITTLFIGMAYNTQFSNLPKSTHYTNHDSFLVIMGIGKLMIMQCKNYYNARVNYHCCCKLEWNTISTQSHFTVL